MCKSLVFRMLSGSLNAGSEWPAVFLAAFALVEPTLGNRVRHQRLVTLIRWVVILIIAITVAVLAVRLPM